MTSPSTQFHTEIGAIIGVVERAISSEEGDTRVAELQDWLSNSKKTNFAKLSAVFQLSPREMCLLECLAALHFDPGFASAFRKITEFPYVHEALVRRLFRLDLTPIYTSGSALNLWQLVRARDMGVGLPLGFELNLAVVEWLAGKPGLEPVLRQCLTRIKTGSKMADWGPERVTKTIRSDDGSNRAIVCEFTGSDRIDYLRAAAAVCAGLGSGLWAVEERKETLDDEQVMRIHRFAAVQNAALFWHAAESEHLVPRISPSARLQFIANSEMEIAAPAASHRYLAFQLPQPGLGELRTQLRARFAEAPEDAVGQVAAMKGVSKDLIEDPNIPNIDALSERLLMRNTRALRAWAMPLATNMRFSDLVVAEDLKNRLQGLVSEIAMQHRIWENPEVGRVYAQERALTILLQGPPGCGKTLSAKVLAGEAGLPLFRVDVASLTSKYRGETTKNLRALFRAANQSGAILFVDEFEAVASKRTEARNEIARADNQDTAYFLQLIENAYEGVVICATNRAMDVDEAMLRRIRHTLDFHPPGESERKALWRLALAPFEPDADVQAFARLLAPVFEFSGARIKAVVLNAFALSGGSKIQIQTLRKAALAEAQINGRLPGKREMQRIVSFETRDAKEAAE